MSIAGVAAGRYAAAMASASEGLRLATETGQESADAGRPRGDMIVIGHRGASGYRPELRAVGDLPAELRQFCELGVDGLFSDNPDLAVATPRRAVRDQRNALGPSRAAPGGRVGRLMECGD